MISHSRVSKALYVSSSIPIILSLERQLWHLIILLFAFFKEAEQNSSLAQLAAIVYNVQRQSRQSRLAGELIHCPNIFVLWKLLVSSFFCLIQDQHMQRKPLFPSTLPSSVSQTVKDLLMRLIISLF